MAGEFDLIESIRHSVTARPGTLIDVGIGDDCAVIRQGPYDQRWLVTTDMLMEGRHFPAGSAAELAFQIGRKAMAVNISDIAAMAGTPVCAFASVAVPRNHTNVIAKDLMRGLHSEAARFDICIAGGDTNVWDGPLVINITLMGLEPAGGAVLRSGARPGDFIFVSGPLGGSLRSGRHLRPEPRVSFAQELKVSLGDALRAMIDLSDGLGGDLRHILSESGQLGAMLEAAEIPIHTELLDEFQLEERMIETLLPRALSDGEDFELCFCVDPEAISEVPEGVHRVGTITEDHGILVRWPDGRVMPWEKAGFDHFHP
jgi:thiamine-monophosphate kinase